MRHLRSTLIALMSGLVLVTCDLSLGPDDGERDRLEENRRRWAQRGYASYDLTVQRLCFCGFTEPVRVEVRNGERSAVVVAATGDPVPATIGPFPTVPGLFGIVADAIQRDAHELDVRYDAELGVPERIEIDYEENVIDEEVTWVVVVLVPR